MTALIVFQLHIWDLSLEAGNGSIWPPSSSCRHCQSHLTATGHQWDQSKLQSSVLPRAPIMLFKMLIVGFRFSTARIWNLLSELTGTQTSAVVLPVPKIQDRIRFGTLRGHWSLSFGCRKWSAEIQILYLQPWGNHTVLLRACIRRQCQQMADLAGDLLDGSVSISLTNTPVQMLAYIFRH